MYKVIDLFAGAGGLSLGFMQTQKYDIKVAFENNPTMQETYRKNHPGVDVRGDVCAADYEKIQEQYGEIDVVIGGPPCQGFSNANRQKNHAISQNNMLVKQYIRAIRELQPKAFVMENVSMLRSDVHRFYLDETDSDLFLRENYEIPMQETKLLLLEKEFCFDGAIDIVQSLDSVNENLLPEDYYFALNVIYKATRNPQKIISALAKHRKNLLRFADELAVSSTDDLVAAQTLAAFNAVKGFFEGSVMASDLKDSIEPAIMTQRMLSRAKEIFENHLVVDSYTDDGDLVAVIRSYAVFDYLKAILESEPNSYVINADVLCAANYGAPQKRNRFVVIGIKKSYTDEVKLPVGSFTEETYHTVRDAIYDLQQVKTVIEVAEDVGTVIEDIEEISDLGASLRDSDILFNHIVTNTREIAMERFKALKQGQNFHSLDDGLKNNTYTDVSRTQNTIYLRLDYDQPSGTVVNVRKSMWVHPELDRAVSVREAARLQTFPDSFIFCGTKDKQYQQVGNAVPPIMAKAIAKKLAQQLKKIETTSEL